MPHLIPHKKDRTLFKVRLWLKSELLLLYKMMYKDSRGTQKKQTTTQHCAILQLPFRIIMSRKLKNFSVIFDGQTQMKLKYKVMESRQREIFKEETLHLNFMPRGL